MFSLSHENQPISSSSTSSFDAWSAGSSSDEEYEEHGVGHTLWFFFAHHACCLLLQGKFVRNIIVKGGFDVSLCVGCDLSLSNLNFGDAEMCCQGGMGS